MPIGIITFISITMFYGIDNIIIKLNVGISWKILWTTVSPTTQNNVIDWNNVIKFTTYL